MRNTSQVTERVALQCSDTCKARIMAEIIYDFLCLYGLMKVGMISTVEERTMPDIECIGSSCARGYQRH